MLRFSALIALNLNVNDEDVTTHLSFLSLSLISKLFWIVVGVTYMCFSSHWLIKERRLIDTSLLYFDCSQLIALSTWLVVSIRSRYFKDSQIYDQKTKSRNSEMMNVACFSIPWLYLWIDVFFCKSCLLKYVMGLFQIYRNVDGVIMTILYFLFFITGFVSVPKNQTSFWTNNNRMIMLLIVVINENLQLLIIFNHKETLQIAAEITFRRYL